MNEQAEIPIPTQPARITLHRARVMRDVLEKRLSIERPLLAPDVTAVALQFNGALDIYRKIRPSFYRKRTLDQLHDIGRFIAALERKSSRKCPPPPRTAPRDNQCPRGKSHPRIATMTDAIAIQVAGCLYQIGGLISACLIASIRRIPSRAFADAPSASPIHVLTSASVLQRWSCSLTLSFIAARLNLREVRCKA